MSTTFYLASERELPNRQAALAAGLLAGVFVFGHYFGDFASFVMILVSLILLAGYPVLGIPLWLWCVLAVWLVCR